MHRPDPDIERLLAAGFSRLPIDSATVAQATESIMRKADEVRCAGKRRYFPVSVDKRLFALAATILLFCGFGYALLQLYGGREGVAPKSEIAATEKRMPRIELLSYVGDSIDKYKYSLPSGPDARIVTDGHTQVLLGIGRRTRTICSEGSVVTVGRADSLRTTITLLQGAIAVDIGPDGNDTVSIVTASVSITHRGTRFSVHSDSVKGVSVEVYNGGVHIRDIQGRNFNINAGEGWKNGSRGNVVALDETIIGENAMNAVFASNHLERKLQWNLDNEPTSAIFGKKNHAILRSGVSGKVATTAVFTADSIVQTIGILVDHDEYTAIDSIVNHLEDRTTLDTLVKMIVAAADRKIALLQFVKASKLLEIVEKNGKFTLRQRENAAVRNFVLRKNHLKISREDLFASIREYQRRFPEGNFGDDMAAEAITLLLATRKTDEAIIEMRRFLRSYPTSSQNEYYRYVYASTLGEKPSRASEALIEYEKYLTLFPQGKYREDALYWIVKLNGSLNNAEAVERFKNMYLRQFPRGRWAEEIGSATIGVHIR